jgi:hypothetical protein
MPSAAAEAFEKIVPELRPVAEAARAAVMTSEPGLREDVKWGNLCFADRRAFLAIIGHRTHVNLQFWEGVAVDPEGRLLEGTGKALRHFKMRCVEDARRPDLMALVAKARELDRMKESR